MSWNYLALHLIQIFSCQIHAQIYDGQSSKAQIGQLRTKKSTKRRLWGPTILAAAKSNEDLRQCNETSELSTKQRRKSVYRSDKSSRYCLNTDYHRVEMTDDRLQVRENLVNQTFRSQMEVQCIYLDFLPVLFFFFGRKSWQQNSSFSIFSR